MFFVGSASAVSETAPVVEIVLVKDFQVPNTALGAIGVPPCCQSPLVLFGSAVMSVMNSEGDSGRPDASVPP